MRAAVLGDSITAGSAQSTGMGLGTWFGSAALQLGWDDPFNEALGGTGYVNPGQTAALGDRVADDVVAYRPSKVVVWGGYNDAGSPQTTIRSRADALYADLRRGLPDAQVFVLGTWSPSGSPSAALRATDETLRAAAAGAGLPFLSPLTGSGYDAAGTKVLDGTPWITGTGRAGAAAGDGNADSYVGSDGVHPTDAGHRHLADVIARGIQTVSGAPGPGGLRLTWSASTDDVAVTSYEVHRQVQRTSCRRQPLWSP